MFTLGKEPGPGGAARSGSPEAKRAGRRAVFTSVGPMACSCCCRGRLGGYLQEGAARLEGAGEAGQALGQQRGLERAAAGAVAGRQHLAGEVVQGVVGFWGDSRTGTLVPRLPRRAARRSPSSVSATPWAQGFPAPRATKEAGERPGEENHPSGSCLVLQDRKLRLRERGIDLPKAKGLQRQIFFWMPRAQNFVPAYLTVLE